MQTFSKMQRNSAFKTLIGLFSLFILFAFYIFLGDIYVFLPPMLGVLFLCFSYFWRQREYSKFFLILGCLFWIELDKNLAFGGLFILYLSMYVILYLPLFYFFANTIWIKTFFIFVVYFVFGIFYYLFFASSFIDWWQLISLFAFYIFVEEALVLIHELKN